MHGYIANSIENDPKIDQKTPKLWTRSIKIRLMNSKHMFLVSKTKKLLRNA